MSHHTKHSGQTWADPNKTGHTASTTAVTTPYQYQYGSYSTKTCQHPPKSVQVGDTFIYACAQRDVDIAVKTGFDVISPLVQSAGTEFNGYYGLLLWFPIPDMTAPEPKRLRIHAQRLITYAKAGNHVVTFCHGSHGRTGTVLATCIGLLEPDVDPIDTVRARHCEHAVETQSQVEAIFKALERELPEKWKPNAAVIKYQPAWVGQGLLWDAEKADPTTTLVTPATDDANSNNCDLCNTAGYGVGVNKLHWFGHVKSHMDCYEKAEKSYKAKQKAAAEIKSSTAPSADSPPVAQAVSAYTSAEIDDGGPQCGVGVCVAREAWHIGNALGHDFIAWDGGPSNAEKKAPTTSNVEGLTENERPFFANWSAKQKRRFRLATNTQDQFGDLVCPKCAHLITNPYQAELVKSKATHKNCEDSKKFIESVPLCLLCSADYVFDPEVSDHCVNCETLANASEV